MKWKATISYREFVFDSGEQAVAFAEDAVEHFLPDKEDKKLNIELVPLKEGVNEDDD